MSSASTSIYKDIQTRTGGDIYIGVVGPVRTGKSTFIKRFMDSLVIPNIEDSSKKERATDIPSWAHGSRPKKGESGNEYAIRKMNEHYGKGKWTRKGKQGKEYSELRKWGDRGR